MYSTCLFCHTELGANEAVEHFPIGRRLAFDAAKGRLWVVCRKCERWNLTPIEERWEAIEECERSYRGTKLRVSTDHIGLARVAEGLELVRIGKPQRPEFAAWRYGDQFGRRRRKYFIQGAVALAGAATIPLVGPVLGLSMGAVGGNLFSLANFGYSVYSSRRVVARVHDSDGSVLQVRALDAGEAEMLPPTARDAWGIRLTYSAPTDRATPWWRYGTNQEQTDLRGGDAMRAAAQLLPRFNVRGASARQLKSAIAIATEYEDPSTVFDRAARIATTEGRWRLFLRDSTEAARLSRVPAEVRLALEMVSHEESERRALEGELYLLEDAWKEAEEIAAISDDMFLPEDISRRLTDMKKQP
jgi:hypothetical protein